MHKDFGLVLNVFDDKSIFTQKLHGHSAIGHNRYSTSGSAANATNIQPFRVHYSKGNLALGHNGNLTNARQLRDHFINEGVLFQSTSDTELILHLISHSRKQDQLDQILDALSKIEGAYCLVILTDDKLIAVRDPNGFRPLALGKLDDSYVVASETCAFDIIGAEYIREIKPGEVLIIDRETINGGDIKSHFLVGRTFISPGQESRDLKVRTKFNTVKGVIEDRPVIIVDDSIVRGTTSRYLVNMIRQCNPTEVHFMVSSPQIVDPCFYGMDFPSPDELIANRFNRDPERIAESLGVDSLHYLSPEGLVAAVKEANPKGQEYCTACFTGNYPVPVEAGVKKEENELI
ncbi:MAG: amidophosphoribosyltransferase [Rhodothermaceae bacterium]|nr:amidophosphoribosyltransferase [Rhodothermaceae bacterium]